MSDIFEKINSNYNTRRSTKMLLLPRKNTSNGQKGLSYLGPKYWNILPSEIKLSSSTNAFKHAIKSEFYNSKKLKMIHMFIPLKWEVDFQILSSLFCCSSRSSILFCFSNLYYVNSCLGILWKRVFSLAYLSSLATSSDHIIGFYFYLSISFYTRHY